MKSILKDVFDASIGLTKVTKEQIEKIFNELKKRGEVEEKDRKFFISKAIEKLEKTGKDVTEKIMDTLNPNSEKIDKLTKKIDKLVEEIEGLKKEKKKG